MWLSICQVRAASRTLQTRRWKTVAIFAAVPTREFHWQ